MSHGLPHHNIENLRLQIETSVAGLPNLAQNPSGDRGSWGYITPVANTVLTAESDADGTYLKFTNSANQAAYWTTELLAVTAGVYVAARFDTVAGSTGSSYNVKCRFEWYDSDRVLLSSSTQTAAITPTAGVKYVTASQAPTNTAYVKLRWDFYNNTGNPSTATNYRLRKVMVTWAPTTAEIGSSRANLVPNPSFEVNAEGWGYDDRSVTSIARSTAQAYSGSASLAVTLEGYASSIARITSEGIAVQSGAYYAMQLRARAATAGRPVRLLARWYDSFGTYLSSTGGSTVSDTSGSWTLVTHTLSAPTGATTAFVEVTFGVAGNMPAAGEVHYIDAVQVEQVETIDSYFDGDTTDTAEIVYTWTGSRTRTNLVKNPSFQVNTTAWVGTATTVSRDTAFSHSGSASMLAESTGASNTYVARTGTGTNGMPVTGGHEYAGQAWVRLQSRVTTSNFAQLEVEWYDSSGNSLGSAAIDSQVNMPVGTWFRISGTEPAPLVASFAMLRVTVRKSSGSVISSGLSVFHLDDVSFERSYAYAEPLGYFDGDTTDDAATTYAWTGTASNSASTATRPAYSLGVTQANSYAYSEPRDWRNILGPVHEIKVTRDKLDVGLMTATVLDELLDPAVEADVRPGRKVRLQALIDDEWTSTFEGTTTRAFTAYLPRTRIEISASDAIAHLSNQGENRVPAGIADLPVLLEGKGVPWDVNGSGNQEASASVVAYNENASIVDQVALARDTDLGYAWVSRDGTLRAYEPTLMPSTPLATAFDEALYSTLDVAFDTEECINSVSVKFLRYDVGAGTTEEVVYGPYRDTVSIAEWGAHSAEFTISGAVESEPAIEAYAQAILDRNAQPVVKVNSLAIPVLDATSFGVCATVDLYDAVDVHLEGRVDDVYRVTSLEHEITPLRWLTTVGFGSVDAVATPTWIPSPPFSGTTP